MLYVCNCLYGILGLASEELEKEEYWIVRSVDCLELLCSPPPLLWNTAEYQNNKRAQPRGTYSTSTRENGTTNHEQTDGLTLWCNNTMQCNAMQCNAMQCNAMQCNAMQCNAIQYNTMQYYTILYNTIQYYTILCNTMQYYAILCNTIQYNTIQYYTILYNTIQYYTILY